MMMMMMPGNFVLDPNCAAADDGEEVAMMAGAVRPRDTTSSGRTQGSPPETETAAAAEATAAEFRNASQGATAAECSADQDLVGDHETKMGVVGPGGGGRLGGACSRTGNALTPAAGQRRRPRTVSAASAGSGGGSCSAPSSTERTTDGQAQAQEDPPPPPNNSSTPALRNAIPALHQNLDAAYERLSALLGREQRRGQQADAGSGRLEHHVAKPRLLIRKRGGAAYMCAADTAGDERKEEDGGSRKKKEEADERVVGVNNKKCGAMMEHTGYMADDLADGLEGRQPIDEFDRRQIRRGSGGGGGDNGTCIGSTSAGSGNGEAILRQLLLRVGEDEEVAEVHVSDVGLVYRRAGLDRTGQVLAHLHRLATAEFRESEEIVEVS